MYYASKRWLKFESLTMPSVRKDTELLVLSYTDGGIEHECKVFEISLMDVLISNTCQSLRPSTLVPRCILSEMHILSILIFIVVMFYKVTTSTELASKCCSPGKCRKGEVPASLCHSILINQSV